MADSNNGAGGGAGQQGAADSQTGGAAGGEAKFTQADIDRIVDQRLARERAKFGDYDELKRKAGDYDKLSAQQQAAADAQKTEAQRIAERLAAAERAAADAGVQLLRFKVATEKQVPADLVEFLTATDEKGLRAQADKLMEKGGAGRPASFDNGPRGSGSAKPTDMNALIRQAAGLG